MAFTENKKSVLVYIICTHGLKTWVLNHKTHPGGFLIGFNSRLNCILLGKPTEHKGRKRKGRIPTDDLIPKNRLCRNQHLRAFQIPSACTNAYLNSFPSDYIHYR